MIRAVSVINDRRESLRMDLFKPEDSGLLVSNLTGIGAPGADVNLTAYAVMDGGIFSSARARSRTITLVVEPLWREHSDIETARQLTYKYFPIKHKVTLEIETDNRTLAIDGYVKNNDPDIFKQSESITIVIECPNPYFYDAKGDAAVVFSGIEPCFQFPFSNNKIEDDTAIIHHVEYDLFGRPIAEWDEEVVVEGSHNLLKMGEIKNEKKHVIVYDGEIETGFVCTIQAKSNNITNILIWKSETNEFIKINTDKIQSVTGTAFSAGDMLKISTVSGDRYVKIIRGNGETNVISAFDLASTWIPLTQGSNTLWFTADSGADNMLFDIRYRRLYQGV